MKKPDERPPGDLGHSGHILKLILTINRSPLEVFGRNQTHIAALKGGCLRTLEKDTAMTMLNHTSSDSVTLAAFLRSLRYFTARLSRRIKSWVAAVVAHREQQAQSYVLRHLSDRELRDFGLSRSQIGNGLAEAAKERARCQQLRK